MTKIAYFTKLILLLINLFCNLIYVNPFRFPVRSIYSKSNDIRILEPIKNTNFCSKPISDVIFLSGGANFIPNEIYNNFLDNMASSNFRIFLSDYTELEEFDKLIESIDSTNILVIIHSSSTKLAIDLSNKHKNIKKIVFLDPVDNRSTFKDIYKNILNKPNKINVDIDEALIINAQKSYVGSWNPPSIPFIPVLSLNKENLILNNNRTIETITFEDFGHTDLLDKPWADIMHKSKVSIGTYNRKFIDINNYHQDIVDIIVKFCKS